MIRKFALSMLVVSTCSLATGQKEVPPAFEKAPEKSTESREVDPFDPILVAPKMVRVQVEMIQLPHTAATRLLMEEKSKTMDAAALRGKVLELVEKGEAKLIDTQVVLGRSGQKSTVESIQELIYPTEYETAEQMIEKLKESLNAGFPSNVGMPTSFETRNIGSTLEVEPVIAEDDKIIDLRFIPELIWHTGDRVWQEGKDAVGNPFRMTMPDFYTVRLNTSITCADGQYALAGVLGPKTSKGELDPDHRLMVFVKCDILLAIP